MLLNITRLAVAVAILAGFLFINLKQIDPDLGWHLRVGEQVVTAGKIQTKDTFSHTMPGFEWVNHEWLVDAWFWLMKSHGLWTIVTVIFALLAFLPFLIWIIRAERLSWLWFISLAALAFTMFIGVRPQIISFFLFFSVFEIFKRNETKWRWIILPFVFFIWANLHGGFIAGLMLFGCFLVSWKLAAKNIDWKLWKFNLQLKAEPSNISSTQYTPALISFGASVLATLINYNGWKLYSEVLTILLSPEVKYIQEWVSVASSGSIPILIFLAAFLTLFIYYWRQYSAVTLIPLVFFFATGVKPVRNFPLFMIMAMPFMFSAIELLRRDITKSQELSPFSANTWKMLRLSAAGLFVVLASYFGYTLWTYHSYPYPEKAVDFLEEKVKNSEWPDAILLNEYGWGGYLIWRLPGTKVFIDGRMPHWTAEDGNSAMKDYISIQKPGNPEDKKSILEKRKVNTIIAGNNAGKKADKSEAQNGKIARIIMKINAFFYGEENANLKEELLKSGWGVAYEDPGAIILRKQDL